MSAYYIDGYNLTLDVIRDILNDDNSEVMLSEQAEKRCRESRAQIDRWLEKDAPVIYGVNTGLGNLKDVVVPPEKHIEWNKTIPYPHAAGMGEYLQPPITLMSLLLRANVLARAYSGVRPELIKRILSIYNAKVAPAVHSEGSTGLSDLGPLAQNVMTVAGLAEGKAYYEGELMPSREALRRAGLDESFVLECKEVLAQMNGSTMTQAIAVLAFLSFEDVMLEAKRIIYETGCAQELLDGCYEVAAFTKDILNRENNISCDNPLLFELPEGGYEAVMGCNCSNTQVGYALDMMNIVLVDLAGAVLAGIVGDTKREAARFMLDKIKTCAMQVSADSIPTKGGQEDHVEFSYTAARKFYYAVSLFSKIIALQNRVAA